MKISTKTGDKGESQLYSGRHLKKSSLVFEVMGSFDELNAVLGLCKSSCAGAGVAEEKEIFKVLEIMQIDIYRIMAIIGNDMVVPKEIREIDRKDVLLLEQFIEKYEEKGGDAGKFVMPGENDLSAKLHFARTICRRAERNLVEYHNDILVIFGGVPEFILQYVNRLSDLLFLLSRSLDNEK